MKKLGLSFLLTFLVLGLFATATLAAPTMTEPDPAGENVNHNPTIDPAGDVGNLNPNANGISAEELNKMDNFDGVIKSVGMHGGDQKTHTDYQNNTNSCASCHQTHTAKADNLLFADSVYQTCSACHDGTLGFYNVFETGAAYMNSPSTAGTFGGSHANNMSVHNVDSTVAIKAAPGGNKNGTGTWAAEFNCASCHAPHGSYSDRLLHYNPNGMGQRSTEEGGIGAVNTPVRAFASRTGSGFELLRGTPAQLGMTGTYPEGTVAIRLYNNGNLDKTPWLYGYSGNPRTYLAQLTNANGDRINYQSAGIYVNHEKGYIYSQTAAGATLLNSATIGNIARAYVVKLDFFDDYVDPVSEVVTKHNVSALWASGSTTGPQMSSFCASCHTDYMIAGSNSGRTSRHGNYDGETFYGHTTTSANYTCLRCHYAHGTDAEIMVDAQGDTIYDLMDAGWSRADALDYMLDRNPSSALKKFTGMSGCWACHNSSKASSLKNTERVDGHPTGMFADPSTKKKVTDTNPGNPTPPVDPDSDVVATGTANNTLGSSIPVLATPNTGATELGRITNGTQVKIVETSGLYHKIKYNNGFGYVRTNVVSNVTPK